MMYRLDEDDDDDDEEEAVDVESFPRYYSWLKLVPHTNIRLYIFYLLLER